MNFTEPPPQQKLVIQRVERSEVREAKWWRLEAAELPGRVMIRP